ncbi:MULTISPECIES: autotransporter outer membrane beta-barrel domain-containing protein [unclassified Anaerobiospirillum]|uniref:autotransporter outer membrane beta-barrel domain-containing protein n=1 Tax=unclassified Anaerobiospirillum TaxID=2647410 RepID=UPI001FF4209C|nr:MULTISPECIES: autotransporter outer membrane beta-barrel domain-containing protein [unclassified Anaerobiospirillum]MCK0534813.1 autotransporter outer membrane beta-barrel domain-containing protein [Anaerobiospirillum sp. NML120511]MCK0539873.1 autotransporter outer membrane beta-barrel domain-containing protein [Anaerobiospirillum sp. NML02-A-032]
MKQTNSTITFLSAQYRAVMKDAYLKGLASTALLSTAALASVYSTSTQAAELNNLEELKNGGDFTLSSDKAPKQFNVDKQIEWNGNLSITAGPAAGQGVHSIKSNGPSGQITGGGSLSLESSDRSIIAIGEPNAGYEFKMDIGSVGVQQGELRLRSGFHSGGNVQLSADSITIGSGQAARASSGGADSSGDASVGPTAIIHVASQGNNGATATLGRAASGGKSASEIHLNEGGMIIMNGKKAENAVLLGTINGNGGIISFAEHNNKADFNNNGTIKATGSLNGTTIKVGQNRTAVFDFDKALDAANGETAHMTIGGGTIEINGNASPANAGKVELRNGIMELTPDTKLVSKDSDNGRFVIGDGNTSLEARLKTSTQQVTDFVNGGGEGGGQKGTVVIKGDGVLDFSSEGGELKLDELQFSVNPEAGKIGVESGGTIAATTIAIDKAISDTTGPNSVGRNLNLEADTLQLTESGDANIDYNFNKAAAKNLQLNAAADGVFNLKNKVEIINSEYVDNKYDPDAQGYYAAQEGTVEGAVQLDSGSRLTIGAGKITSTGEITVGEGVLQVGGLASDTQTDGVDSTLHADGGLHLSSKSSTSIKIYGNGEQQIDGGTGIDGQQKPAFKYHGHASVDLTKGKLTVDGVSHRSTFDIKDGSIKLNEANGRELLNLDNQRSGNLSQGAAVFLGGNASMVIEGDIYASGGKAISTDRISKVSSIGAVKTDSVGMSGTGNMLQANNIHLQGNSIDLGNGNTLKAAGDLKIDEQKADSNVTITSGKVIAGSRISSDSGMKELLVGNSGGESASLELGFAERDRDEFGQLTDAGLAGQFSSVSANTGTVDMSVKLNGMSADKLAALKVKYGQWTAKDVDASTNALIEVGTESGAGDLGLPQYGNGTPALNAGKVVLGANSKIVVHEQSSASFTSAEIQSGTITAKGDVSLGELKMSGGSIDSTHSLAGGNMAFKDATVKLGGALRASGSGSITNTSIEASGNVGFVGDMTLEGTSKLTANKDLTVNGKAVLNSGTTLNVSGAMVAGAASFDGANVVIGPGTDDKLSQIDNFSMSDGKLTLNGKMVVGKAPFGTSDTDKEKYGYTTTGGAIDIQGATAQMELGPEALRHIKINYDITGNNGNDYPPGWTPSVIDPDNKITNNITIKNGGTLKLDLGTTGAITAEDLKKLKEQFLTNPQDPVDGTFDIGDTQIAELDKVIRPDGTADWQILKVFMSQQGLDGFKNDKLANAKVVNIRDGEKVVVHAGSMAVDGSHVVLGNGSLSNAEGNGGMFISDTKNNAVVSNATLDSGAAFKFINGGKLGNVILKDGSSTDETILAVTGNNAALTEMKNVEGGKYTNMQIEATTTVAENISKVANITAAGTTVSVGKHIDQFTKIDLSNAVATVGENIENGQTLNINSGSTVTVSNNVAKVAAVNVNSGSLKVGQHLYESTNVNVAKGAQLQVTGDIKNVANLKSQGDLKVDGNILSGGNLQVDGKTAVIGDISVRNLTGKAVTADGDSGVTLQAASLHVGAPEVTDTTDYTGNMKISGHAAFINKTVLSGNNEFGSLEFGRDVHLAKGDNTTGSLKLAKGVEARVGSDGKNGTARIVTGHTDLAGGTIIADPGYGEQTTIVAMKSVGNSTPVTPEKPQDGTGGGSADAGGSAGGAHGAPAKLAAAAAVGSAGELNGTLVALKNSVVAMGTEASDVDGALKELQTAFAPYFKNGSLQDPVSSPEAVGAIAYVAKPVTVQNGSKIVVDASRSYSEYQSADADYKSKVASNDVYMGKGSALAMHNSAVNSKANAAITFNKPDASIYAQEGAKVLIAGTTINPNGPIRLFEDQNGSVDLTTENNATIKVESVNGLFEAPDGLNPGKVGDVTMVVRPQVAEASYKDISSPVREALAVYGGFDGNPEREKLRGEVAPGVTYNPDKKQFSDSEGNILAASKYVSVDNGDGTYSVYHAASNPLLNHVVTATNSGRDAEAVARMANLGGVAKTAIAANETTVEAIAAHAGLDGNDLSTYIAGQPRRAVPWMNDKRNYYTAASAQNRGSVWMTPTYKKVDSKGLKADDRDYGNEAELNGLVAGIDVRLGQNTEVGAVVSAGTGTTSSTGMVEGVENDTKYVGAGAYARISNGTTTVLADATYTRTDNDLSAETALGKATANVDTEVISAGLTARHDIRVGGNDITPHVGARFTRISTDDHEVSINNTSVASVKSDTQNLVSVPVGVTISRNIKQGTWSIKPSVDLTVTAYAGDKDNNSKVKWTGVSNMSTPLSSQVVDDVTAGVKAGVSMRNGNFAAGASVSYTASENIKDLAIQANARYDY